MLRITPVLTFPRISYHCLQGEETGYGKSPEWVEVDGMIVSRGGASTLTNSLNHTNSTITTAIHGGHQAIHGSVLSLPYSSRTQLTYNSTNSTQRSSGRSCDADTLEYPPMRLPQPPLIHNEVDYEDEEPPYETIPSVPPNINITLNEQFGVS